MLIMCHNKRIYCLTVPRHRMAAERRINYSIWRQNSSCGCN